LEVSVDRDSLEKTHDEWLCLAEKAMFDFKRTGISLQKVYIDIEELIAWCQVKTSGKRRCQGGVCPNIVETEDGSWIDPRS
jgi:hypothetical protein